MQIGRNRIWPKTLLHGGHRLVEDKTSAAMADIKNHAPSLRLEQIRPNLACRIQHRDKVNVHMSRDIARPQPLRNELFIGTFASEISKIHHDRQRSELARVQ